MILYFFNLFFYLLLKKKTIKSIKISYIKKRNLTMRPYITSIVWDDNDDDVLKKHHTLKFKVDRNVAAGKQLRGNDWHSHV